MIYPTTKIPLCYSRFFLLTLATAVLLTGCGGSSDDKSIDNTTTEATATNVVATNAPATNTPATNVVTNNSSTTIVADTTNSDAQSSHVAPSTQTNVTTQTQQNETDSQSNQQAESQVEPASQNTPPTQTNPVSPPEQSSDSSQDSTQDSTQDENQESETQTEPASQSTPPTQINPISPPEQSSDSSNQESTQEIQNTPQNIPSTKRILPLGDSITNGGEGFPSYRRSLWFMLRNGDYDVDFIGSQRGFDGPVSDGLKDFDLDHEGHWAWEMGELENSLSDWINDYTPDIVLIHAGTNDVDRGQSHSSTISELDSIINILRNKNANVVVLLAKIIPMKNRDTADFNEFIESFAESKTTSASPVVIVDQHVGYDPSNDNHDNYHPNSRGEEKMATRWLNALEPFLN